MAAQDVPSLYDRLGGVYNIATVVDDFIDRIMVDARLNANLGSTRRTIVSRRLDSSTS
jgi:truncated hemoglobin YjbI